MGDEYVHEAAFREIPPARNFILSVGKRWILLFPNGLGSYSLSKSMSH